METSIFDLKTKEKVGVVSLDERLFNIPLQKDFIAMHLRRSKCFSFTPTNKTKNIAEVSGTTKKPYKQKHTGNARQGSLRSAQFVGGGVAFGPRGLKRFIKLPKSEVCLAKSMVLSEALKNNKLFVVNSTDLGTSKTKVAKQYLNLFSERKIILIHSDVNSNSLLAVRNIPGVKFVNTDMLTFADLMHSDCILIDKNVLDSLVDCLVI